MPVKNKDKGMAPKSGINRIRTLYAIFIVVVVLCISMFFLNIVTAADPIEVAPGSHNGGQYGLVVTDLRSNPELYAREFEVDSAGDGLKATASINRFDVSIIADNPELLPTGKATWCMALQVISALVAIAIAVLVVVALVSFYISVRRGKVFPVKKIKLLTWVGVLMIAMSLMMDASTWMETSMISSLLSDTDWQPKGGIAIHITRIFFGLTIIFLAEIFKIGRDMQDEQELTI